MLRFSVVFVCLLCATYSMMASGANKADDKLQDLFYGEALFYAYQNRFFDAIVRLDTELAQFYNQDDLSLDPFVHHRNEAEFSVGDLEISYRMHLRAGRALKAIMEGKVPQATRNLAAYRLARILFQKRQPVNALHVIERITGEVPDSIKVEELFLRGQIYLATGRFTEAVQLFQGIQNQKKVKGFAAYNLGIALIQNDQEVAGFKVLDQFGEKRTGDQVLVVLKDKANLALGFQFEKKGLADKAKLYLSRVRLDGPFSNKALLKSGWMNVSLGRFDRALVPWSLLHKRQVNNASVQESLLAVPYAYGKLKIHGKAAVLYGHAMKIFGTEVDRLDASIKSIRAGNFLQAILREEAKQDSLWLYKLRDLPDAPETRYIMDLMASHEFQESLKNYNDLAELKRILEISIPNLAVYEQIIELRKRYYEPLLPTIEVQFRNLDTRIKLRVGQRDRLHKRIQFMLIARRPFYLATAFEHKTTESLKRMQHYYRKNPADLTDHTKARIERLKGIIQWNLESEYDERLTKAYKHSQELDGVIEKLKIQYQAFIRTRQVATQSYQGYDTPIRQLRTRGEATLRKIKAVMARQGRLLETMAINELDRRRKKLEQYQVKARFALAESYDRANKAKEKELLQ